MNRQFSLPRWPFAFSSEPGYELDGTQWERETRVRSAKPNAVPANPIRLRASSPSSVRNYHHALGRGVLVRLRPGVAREMEEQEIIGRDDTRRKADGTSIPFRWVCSLKTRFRDPGSDSLNVQDFDAGTGVLIDAQYVLTAAHNVYAEITGSKGIKDKRKALRIWVYPGRNGATDLPFGEVEAADFRYPKAFEKDLDPRWDYALIKLKTAIGEQTFKRLNNQPLGWWGSAKWGAGTVITALGRNYLQDKIVRVSGYPNDKNHEQYFAYDVVNNANPTVKGAKVPELITYLVDTKTGQSGAPVWRKLENGQKRCLVAIHHGECHELLDGCKPTANSKPTSNMGVLLTSAVLDQIAAWKKEM